MLGVREYKFIFKYGMFSQWFSPLLSLTFIEKINPTTLGIRLGEEHGIPTLMMPVVGNKETA